MPVPPVAIIVIVPSLNPLQVISADISKVILIAGGLVMTSVLPSVRATSDMRAFFRFFLDLAIVRSISQARLPTA